MTDTVHTSNRIGALQIAIILLALATAIIHIVLAIPETLIPFYLNGLGYIALVTALYLPQLSRYQNTIRWVLIAYTAFTVVAWVVVGQRNTIAYVDKAIEVVLLALLFMDGRRAS